MRKHFWIAIVCFVWAMGCERAPNTYPLMPDQVLSFELADPTEGKYDWPVSKNGFAISRPPIYASLIGISDQPLDPIDLKEVPPEEHLEGDAWAKFLRASGTNANHPFQFQPIHHEIDSIALSDNRVSFAFSSDGDRLYLSDGESVTAIELPDDWKAKVPLEGSPVGKVQKELWKWKIPNGSLGNPTLIAITSTGKGVTNEFDFGIRQYTLGQAVKKDEKEEDKQNDEKSAEATSSIGSDLVVVDKATTIRLDLNTGAVLASFPTPATGLDYMTAATDADAVLATNAEGEVFWNDGEAGKWVSVGTKVSPASQIDGRQSVSLHQKGDAFMALDGMVPKTVWLSDGKKTTSAEGPHRLENQPAALAWADSGRYWIGSGNVFYANPKSELGASFRVEKIKPNLIWRPVCAWPQRAGRFSIYTGITVLGLRRLQDGRSMWSLWDMNSENGNHSIASNLFEDAKLERSSLPDRKRPTIAVSIDASRLAYLDPESETPRLRIFYRNPWETADVVDAKQWINHHISGNDEDRRDIDRAAARLNALPMDFYWGRPPQELSCKLVLTGVADLLIDWRGYKRGESYFEKLKQAREEGSKASAKLIASLNEGERDIGTWDAEQYDRLVEKYQNYFQESAQKLNNFDKWQKSGSSIADVAHAIQIGDSARFAGHRDSDSYREKCVECETVLRKVLERPKPSVYTFMYLFKVCLQKGDAPLSVEPEVRRFVKLYPECGSPHITLAMWLMPFSGGNIGEAGSYFQAAMANVNDEMRESTFGITAIRMAEQYGGNENILYTTGISEKRVFRGVLNMLKEEKIANHEWIGGIIWVGAYTDNNSVVQRTCHYYREHFLYPKCKVYDDYPALYNKCYESRPEPR